MADTAIGRVWFMCRGNVCRSPMAEMVFKHLLRERGLTECFEAALATAGTEVIGNSVYLPARRQF